MVCAATDLPAGASRPLCTRRGPLTPPGVPCGAAHRQRVQAHAHTPLEFVRSEVGTWWATVLVCGPTQNSCVLSNAGIPIMLPRLGVSDTRRAGQAG